MYTSAWASVLLFYLFGQCESLSVGIATSVVSTPFLYSAVIHLNPRDFRKQGHASSSKQQLTANCQDRLMSTIICFNMYGELYRIDLEKVMYFQSDDHYTHVYFLSGFHCLIPFGLSKVEAAIDDAMEEGKYHLRMGRKFIINLKAVFHVNAIKQTVFLFDDNGTIITIHLPKPVLRSLMETIGTSKQQ